MRMTALTNGVPVGYSIGVITYNFGIVTLPCNGGNISGYSNVVYIDSRGSRHIFLSGSQAVFPPNTCGQPTTKNMVITDGSGLTWKADTSVPNFGGGQIIFPSGTVYNQDGVSGTSHRLTDSNGNYIQFIQDDSTHSHYIDTLGKTAISIDTSSAAQSKYTYTGSDGLPKEVDVNFTSRTRGASTFCGGYTQINSGTESVLSSIVYPDGSQYSFVFESNTDRLTSVTAPTGEVITYSYPNGGYVCNGVNNTSSPQITVAKTEGTWKYNTTYSGSLNTATVQDPAGNVTGYTFIGEQYAVGPYFEVQRTVNQGASTGIKTVDT